MPVKKKTNTAHRNLRIGTMQEGHLHRSLKFHYLPATGKTEQKIGPYVVDILDGKQIVEIQTANFGSLREKVKQLLLDYQVKVVYPIAQKKTIVKQSEEKTLKRKSPKVATLFEVFNELVYVPELLTTPGFELELVYVHIEELREFDPKRAWRRGHWVVKEKRLLEILGSEVFDSRTALLERVLAGINTPFTSVDVANYLGINRRLAGKITYCFRKANLLKVVEKKGNSYLYSKVI